jgi:PqqD family protein of HPr-rel-A system
MKFLHITNKGMAFDPQSGDSYQLNAPAVIILELLQDKIDQDEIVRKISEQFNISPENALTDVLEFIIQLRVLGLIL